ncbi:TIGR00725 family protein [Desulfitobacterium sp.]|uniref:TIGR00725 family protein n=1 Tax=Desulfitobacterium sp. TaxID=49981 RepID=UPI002C72B177|nr:TIGR00725 family protein [Desulfitobacterium sp.]HVJ49034.1 TIGR00725 family protein [Desulfitobacterium sp.]
MIRIGVIGQSGELPREIQELALDLGREIAQRGCVLLSGGTNGIMEYASKGAKEANGLVVGILPGDTRDRGNSYIDIPITTGLSFDYRSLILVHSSDALIMIGGGNGTLGELSAAYLNRKPVVVLESSGGWSGKIRSAAYEEAYLDERKSIKLDYAQTVHEALDIALSHIDKGLV